MAEYDLVIRGGTLVEGTGVPRYRADLGIKDGRVAQISGRVNAGAVMTASRVIPAQAGIHWSFRVVPDPKLPVELQCEWSLSARAVRMPGGLR